MALGVEVRADERNLVVPAWVTMAAAGCAVAMVASAGDALFLTRVGVRHLGTMFAISSAALIGVLAYVGAIADRADRGRLLVAACLIAAVVLAALGAAVPMAPRGASIGVLIAGKQLAAAVDLAFWVLVAERFDARQGRRLVPGFVAANGIGMVAGAFAVGPLAHAIEARGVLMCGAALFAVAAAFASRFARVEVPHRVAATAPARRNARLDLAAGYRAVRRSPLASRLALLVGIAGAFAPILYYLLGAAAAASFGDEASIAEFLGRYRGAVQVLTVVAQLFVAPILLQRAGVARGLLVAPIGAVAAAGALAVSWTLGVVVAAQASARLFDAAIETPAEKLAQNLLPRKVRGRVAGFIDGVAKRAGAIVGGTAASALVVWPNALSATLVAVAALWMAVAWRTRRRFPDLAVAELAAPGRALDDAIDEIEASLGDTRSLGRLREQMRTGSRGALARDLVLQLGRQDKVDAALELARACADTTGARRTRLLEALADYALRAASARTDPVETIVVLGRIAGDEDAGAEHRELALRALGRLATAARQRTERIDDVAGVRAIVQGARDAGHGAVRLAARAALARFDGDRERLDDSVEASLVDGDRPERSAALDELRAEVVAHASALVVDFERLLDRARALLRAARSWTTDDELVAAVDALTLAVHRVGTSGAGGAEMILLRGQLSTFAHDTVDRASGTSGEVRAAALRLISALGSRADAHLLARCLGDRSEDVRTAAVEGLRVLGGDALEVLLVAASYGRRPARNAALELLRDLRVTSSALDELIEAELVEIDTTCARLAALHELPGGTLVTRRLKERVDEVAHTLFLLLEARVAEPAIGAAARRLLRARDPNARARALEALDTALPRSLAHRVIAALDDGPLDARSVAAAARLERDPPTRDEAVEGELRGDDPLARDLVVSALGSSGRTEHRDAISAAAANAARSFDPLEMFRRLTGDDDGAETSATTDEEDDVPRSVETMMVLSRIGMFSELTTRQLDELADVVAWQVASPGTPIITEGDHGDSMYFVASGTVSVEVAGATVSELGAGEPFGEMAIFEDELRSASIVAASRARVGRINRSDFEELVEDVPGIALAICRVLSRRVREANRASTVSDQ